MVKKSNNDEQITRYNTKCDIVHKGFDPDLQVLVEGSGLPLEVVRPHLVGRVAEQPLRLGLGRRRVDASSGRKRRHDQTVQAVLTSKELILEIVRSLRNLPKHSIFSYPVV